MAHRLSPQAEAELDEIWWYIAEESGRVEVALNVITSITDHFHHLATHPYLGRPRDDLRAGFRSLIVGEYVVLYTTDGADVLIVHIFHGRRDIAALLR